MKPLKDMKKQEDRKRSGLGGHTDFLPLLLQVIVTEYCEQGNNLPGIHEENTLFGRALEALAADTGIFLLKSRP
jgi:hypothetical protein